MSSLTVNVLHEAEGLFFVLDGRIDATNAGSFRDAVSAALFGHDEESIVFDCGKLAYVSSLGLRELLRLRKTLKGDMKLVNVPHEVMGIIEMSGFSQIFDVSGGTY